ncbi:MAG: DUF58 domain-containing protein, partial [Kangiellaceae bacterium]|nr:DUF58 domain-containing protein [Kangiellaceae bacterium]
ESAKFPVSLSSDKFHVALSLGLKGEPMHTVDLEANAENRVFIYQLMPTRGRHRLDRLRVQTLYPLGFLQAWSWVFLDTYCIVYPEPIEPINEQAYEPGESDSDYSNHFKEGTEEFYGLKAYQSGDSMTRIHWKSYAKGKGLQVKQFVDYISEPDVLDYDAFVGVNQELRLSYLCYLLINLQEQDKPFGVKLPGFSIEVGQGVEHLH